MTTDESLHPTPIWKDYLAFASLFYLILHVFTSFAGYLTDKLPASVREFRLLSGVLNKLDGSAMFSCYAALVEVGSGDRQYTMTVPILAVAFALLFVALFLVLVRRRNLFTSRGERVGSVGEEWSRLGLFGMVLAGWFLWYVTESLCFVAHLLAVGI